MNPIAYAIHYCRAVWEINYQESYWDSVAANELFHLWIESVVQKNRRKK